MVHDWHDTITKKLTSLQFALPNSIHPRCEVPCCSKFFAFATTRKLQISLESLHSSGRRDNRQEVSQRGEQLHLLRQS